MRGSRGKIKTDHLSQNKRQCILGKDLCHRQWIFLALPLGPADAPLLLCELSFPVPFALLYAPCRPDKSRRYKFFLKRDALSITRNIFWAPWRVPGLANTVAPPKAPSKIRMGVSTKRGPISTSDISGGPLGFKGSFSIIYPEKTKRCDRKPSRRSKNVSFRKRQAVPDLEVAKPDLGIEDREREDVVDERLCSPSLRWHAKYLLLVATRIQPKKKNEHIKSAHQHIELSPGPTR